MSAQSPCGALCVNIQTGRLILPNRGSAGVPESRTICDNCADPVVIGDVRAAAGCGWRSRTVALPARSSRTDGQRAYVCSWLPSVHPARRSSRCSPGMPSPGRAQRPGRRLNRGSVSGRRCDKGRLHRCRAQQSACGRGPRVAGRRHRCHQQVQSGHLRLV
jgi:hypothetical protein